MNQIVVVSEDQELIDFLAILLEGELEEKVLEYRDLQKAVSGILSNNNIVAIICDLDLPDPVENELFQCNMNTYKIPFIQISETEKIDPEKYKAFFSSHKFNQVLPKEHVHKEILDILVKIKTYFKDDKNKDVDLEEARLCKIKIPKFLMQNIVTGDVFIKIREGKFVKVIKAGEAIDREKILDYYHKGLEYLYQDEKDFKNYMAKAFKKYAKLLNAPTTSKTEKLALQLHSIKEVQDVVRNMGLTDDVIEFTDEIVRSVEGMLQQQKGIGGLVKVLLEKKGPFFTQSSVMNYILGGVCTKRPDLWP